MFKQTQQNQILTAVKRTSQNRGTAVVNRGAARVGSLKINLERKEMIKLRNMLGAAVMTGIFLIGTALANDGIIVAGKTLD